MMKGERVTGGYDGELFIPHLIWVKGLRASPATLHLGSRTAPSVPM